IEADFLSKAEAIPFATLMQVYASDIVRLVKQRLHITLDYSETSLEAIDLLMKDYSGGKLFVEAEMSAEQLNDLWLLCKGIAGYVGEVIIRNIGGDWVEKPVEGSGAVIILRVKERIETPIADAIFRRFTE